MKAIFALALICFLVAFVAAGRSQRAANPHSADKSINIKHHHTLMGGQGGQGEAKWELPEKGALTITNNVLEWRKTQDPNFTVALPTATPITWVPVDGVGNPNSNFANRFDSQRFQVFDGVQESGSSDWVVRVQVQTNGSPLNLKGGLHYQILVPFVVPAFTYSAMAVANQVTNVDMVDATLIWDDIGTGGEALRRR